MSKYRPNITDTWPVSTLSRGHATELFGKVDTGHPQVLSRRSTPAYVIIRADDYEQLLDVIARTQRVGR